MPIYEYVCDSCKVTFEKLVFSGEESSASQCPTCMGIGHKVISCPGIVYSYFRESRPDLLPDWKEKQLAAERHDRALPPLRGDKGKDIKVYDIPFGNQERKQLEQKAQLDNI